MVDGMSGVGKGSNNWYTNLKTKWRVQCTAKKSGQIESEQQQTSGQQGSGSIQSSREPQGSIKPFFIDALIW